MRYLQSSNEQLCSKFIHPITSEINRPAVLQRINRALVKLCEPVADSHSVCESIHGLNLAGKISFKHALGCEEMGRAAENGFISTSRPIHTEKDVTKVNLPRISKRLCLPVITPQYASSDIVQYALISDDPFVKTVIRARRTTDS